MSRPQALVTGGTRGIGRAICIALAKSGYDVAFTFRSNADLAETLVKELSEFGAKAKGYCVDISDAKVSDQLEAISSDFPQVELLVNNAGISIDGLAMRYKLEDFDKILATNIRGAFLTTQSFLRPMMKARKGSIIFISSTAGQMGNVGQVPYSATKSALFGMTKSLAKELGSRGIRVNAIAPGFVKTDMTDALPQNVKDEYLKQIPLDCFGEPDDIAQAVLFLAGDSSKYITGQVLAVNGGLYM
ncbi:MAG: beta-ketoacyl-ACP reductase [Bacteriovoracia bacterium]